MKLSVVLVLMICFSQSWASDEDVLTNIVKLNTSATMQVDNDEMTVLLAVEHQGSNPVLVAQQVNKDMRWALEQVKVHQAIIHETYSYSTRPIYNEKEYREKQQQRKKIIAWRSTQQLSLVSEDIEQLTQLVGQLQNKLTVRHMRFSPSKNTRLEAENRLIEEALTTLKDKVRIVLRTMDERHYRILNIDIGNNQSAPIATYRQGRAQAMTADLAPVVSAGKSEVKISISGRVQLY